MRPARFLRPRPRSGWVAHPPPDALRPGDEVAGGNPDGAAQHVEVAHDPLYTQPRCPACWRHERPGCVLRPHAWLRRGPGLS